MKLNAKPFRTKTMRVTRIEVNDASAVIVTQRSDLNELTLEMVWIAPKVTVKEVEVFDAEHLDLLKDALDIAGELFESWSEDTGKEIAL